MTDGVKDEITTFVYVAWFILAFVLYFHFLNGKNIENQNSVCIRSHVEDVKVIRNGVRGTRSVEIVKANVCDEYKQP